MHILVIYNPVSGIKRLDNPEQIIKSGLKEKQVSYTWFETQPVEHQPLDEVITDEIDRILVAGGDGTVREVAAFLHWKHKRTPIAIVPIGSGNLLAQALGIPVLSLKKSVLFGLAAAPQYIDVMEVNRKHIGLIAAGIGYDSVFISGASRPLKRKIGFFAYVWSFLKTYLVYPKERYDITIDKERWSVYGKTVMIFNVVPPQVLSAPHISPTDGVLNMTIFKPHSLVGFLQSIFLFMFHRNRGVNTQVTEVAAPSCAIKTKHNRHIQIDGEVFKGRNLQVQVQSNALQFIYDKQF